jgi:hypothetical protein
MAGIRISLDFDRGWKRFARATDPEKFRRQLRSNVSAANAKIGSFGKKLVRKTIKEGKLAQNKPLTVFIKGSTKPLIDRSDLWQAITFKQPSWHTVFIGVLQRDEAANIAELLHEGGRIRVTENMRAMFRALWMVSEGKMDAGKLKGRAAELWARRPSAGWLPLSDATDFIEIPARPFIREPLDTNEFKATVKKLWEDAITRTFQQIAARG